MVILDHGGLRRRPSTRSGRSANLHTEFGPDLDFVEPRHRASTRRRKHTEMDPKLPRSQTTLGSKRALTTSSQGVCNAWLGSENEHLEAAYLTSSKGSISLHNRAFMMSGGKIFY